jgi:hypothetical protein
MSLNNPSRCENVSRNRGECKEGKLGKKKKKKKNKLTRVKVQHIPAVIVIDCHSPALVQLVRACSIAARGGLCVGHSLCSLWTTAGTCVQVPSTCSR